MARSTFELYFRRMSITDPTFMKLVAPTLMKKAFQALVTKHYALQKSPVTGQMFDIILMKPKGGDPQVLVESFIQQTKGDPPNPSATAKDIKSDQEINRTLTDPPLLPPHLSEHDRRASRVDTIYADSPIDSSLFSLYIHQNFTQFCIDVDECDGIADWLSWAYSSGGEAASFFDH
ncbi:hypothetical protein BT96DRAFT_1005805 [Gymnopus androsaceus JB14]|uniref:Uncharacterized protein n=1 Tax=Gymnopus androsaceus JB14 TaxID=1447944 RepID=A0A6A4GLV4_9AGAR|nr:hypothetical protein BT96DRAFT_1005805 [Gymnopus androsaceus JB14]